MAKIALRVWQAAEGAKDPRGYYFKNATHVEHFRYSDMMV